jgi:hypothetical protein
MKILKLIQDSPQKNIVYNQNNPTKLNILTIYNEKYKVLTMFIIYQNLSTSLRRI